MSKIILFILIVLAVVGAVYYFGGQTINRTALQGTVSGANVVTVQSPLASSSVISPVQVKASFSGKASYMKLWIDHVASTSTLEHNTSTFNATLTLPNGPHLLEVQAADSVTGVVYTTPVNISVVSEAVTVQSPAAGSSIGSPVHLQAKFNSTASYMKLWVDHVASTVANNTTTFSAVVPLSSGPHILEVQAADAVTGVVYTTPVNVVVGGGQATGATSTLAIEMGNNTSAADNFGALTCKNYYTGGTVACASTGDAAPVNVSKIDVHTLLYNGNSTLVFAHLMPWFGGSSHMNVGYNSNDTAEVARQLSDMISRGVNGISVDWYGPSSTSDQVTQKWKTAVATHPDFLFWIIIDKGSLSNAGINASTSAVVATKALISQVNYIVNTYGSSPNYYKIGGRPVVSNFDLDLHFNIDWPTFFANVSGNPRFIYQNNSGFTHSYTSGSFGWGPSSATSYLSSFYATALSHPAVEAIGSTYKGFNDRLANWTLNRVNAQNCGQTWLQTFAAANAKYSASNQLPAMQLVTWNDYEEGSELETGIDNCVGVSASVNGATLSWSITGNENTVDHYTAFISPDGQNLTELANIPAGTHVLNLQNFAFPSGKYKVFVKAVGKPFMDNHMSAAAAYSL
jgi:hypothetical protein